jgi:hypothetical protein
MQLGYQHINKRGKYPIDSGMFQELSGKNHPKLSTLFSTAVDNFKNK